MELATSVRVTLGARAESLERIGSLGLILGVKLEYEVSDALITLGDGQVDSGVGRASIAVHREATLAEVEQLFCVHLFLSQ